MLSLEFGNRALVALDVRKTTNKMLCSENGLKSITENCREIKKILFLGGFGPVFLAFARSCSARGINVYLLEISNKLGCYRFYSSFLCGCAHIRPDLIGTSKGISKILEYVNSIGAEAIATLADSELLWLTQNRTLFEKKCKVLAPSFSTLKLLSSKKQQIVLAKNANFNVLPTWYLSMAEDHKKIPAESFPICIRPSTGRTVKPDFKVRMIYSPSDLIRFLRHLEIIGAPVIAQPFRNSPSLIVHGVRSKSGQIIALRAFFVPRKFEGFALVLNETKLPEEIQQPCEQFAHSSGIIGVFHFDLIYSENGKILYFLEINARLGGTTDKVLRMGFDEPSLMLAAYGLRGSSKEIYLGGKHSRVVNKRAIIKYMLFAARGTLSILDYPASSPLKDFAYSMKDFLITKDSIFDWKDLRGSLWFHLRRP